MVLTAHAQYVRSTLIRQRLLLCERAGAFAVLLSSIGWAPQTGDFLKVFGCVLCAVKYLRSCTEPEFNPCIAKSHFYMESLEKLSVVAGMSEVTVSELDSFVHVELEMENNCHDIPEEGHNVTPMTQGLCK